MIQRGMLGLVPGPRWRERTGRPICDPKDVESWGLPEADPMVVDHENAEIVS